MPKQLSPTMQKAVEYMREHGNTLIRYPGGYWAKEGWKPYEPHFGTTTVDALVSREAAHYSDWKGGGKSGRFPVAITLNA